MGVTVREKIKGSGQWWVFLNHKGTRRSKLVGDKPTALSVARELKKQIAEGDFSISKKEIPTFREYAEKWLSGYGESSLKYSSLVSYECNLKKHIYPTFGEIKLDTITRPEIKEFVFKKAQELNPKTVKNLVNLMSGIFTHAVEDDIIKVNPAVRMGKYLPKQDKKAKINPLTREEARIFLEAVLKYYPDYYELFLTALRTGLRLGELLALQWGDIDFQGRFIEVRRNWVKGQITTPKNSHMRRVDISEQLTLAFKDLRRQKKVQPLFEGEQNFIFVNGTGKLLDPDNLRHRIFKMILKKAGFRQIRIHDLRHTFASLLLQQGAGLVYVKEQMGHSSIQVTVDIYGHLQPSANRAEVDKLDDAPIRTLSAPYNKKALSENS